MRRKPRTQPRGSEPGKEVGVGRARAEQPWGLDHIGHSQQAPQSFLELN